METPLLLPTTRIGNRVFTRQDIKLGIILKNELIQDPNWFGGRVYGFGKTKEGFYLCVEGNVDRKTGFIAAGDDVIGIYIHTPEQLTEEGINLLKENGLYDGKMKVSVKQIPSESTADEQPHVNMEQFAKYASEVDKVVSEKLLMRAKRESKPVQ